MAQFTQCFYCRLDFGDAPQEEGTKCPRCGVMLGRSRTVAAAITEINFFALGDRLNKSRPMGGIIDNAMPKLWLAIELFSRTDRYSSKGLLIPLSSPIIIGRSFGNLILNDSEVSRAHGRIKVADNHLLYEDLGSANLSYAFNEKGAITPVTATILRDSHKIKIGRNLILIRGCRATPLRGRSKGWQTLPPTSIPEQRIIENWLARDPQLNLRGLGLKTMPPQISLLTHLRELDISENLIESIPDDIGELTELEIIDARQNRLSTLPRTMSGMRNLKEVYLHDNSPLKVPSEILGPRRGASRPPKSGRAIVTFIHRLEQGGGPLNESKLILVGRGGVGKSSLVRRLVSDTFELESGPTLGVQISTWYTRHTLGDVRYNIWDFGGQEIMHATHQFFLSRRTIYILVISGREDSQEQDITYWLEQIKTFSGEVRENPDKATGQPPSIIYASPVIIVANKHDEYPVNIDLRSIRNNYENVCGYVQTDCSTGLGLQALAGSIMAAVNEISDSIKAFFPSAWFQIKERIASMTEPIITQEQYQSICNSSGEHDLKRQEALAEHLHDLGIALNYANDFYIRDTSILSPLWLTDGVYRIITSPLIMDQSGHFSTVDLEAILPPDRYPRHKLHILLNVMLKFSMVLQITRETFLIPALLGHYEVGAPDFAALTGKSITVAYEYSMLPDGLFPRFIARVSDLFTRPPVRWRWGVLVQWDRDGFALIRCDKFSRRVTIEVRGRDLGETLAVIRSRFDELHTGYPALAVNLMVPIPRYNTAISLAELKAFQAAGLTSFQRYIGTKVVSISILELLVGIDESGTPRDAFVRLLRDAYNEDELRSFLGRAFHADLVHWLPSPTTTLASLAFEGCLVLERHGLIEAALDRICVERPRRCAEVETVRRLYREWPRHP